MTAIKGLQKTTLVDFPPYVSATIFMSGCNMRCGFCHNADLVLDTLPEINQEEIFSFLIKRQKILDGVCITGGEPTLYSGLVPLITKIKDLRYKVKLDTNGLMPEVLTELYSKNLLDYVAMDIKSSKDKYSIACGGNVSMDKIEESIKLIRESGVPYEFRTTVIPSLFSKEDALSIGKWLKGSSKYYLQQFFLSEKTLDPAFMKTKPYNISELEELKYLLKPYFGEVSVRA